MLAAPAIEETAQRYAAKGFASVLVYTREAHPGEHFPAHRTFEQKLSHARAFRELFKIQRPILVDDLGGTGHRLYGTLPNMTYLIGRGGRILFRSAWTDPPTVEAILEYILAARSRRAAGMRLAPFYSEFVGYRWHDDVKFQQGLKRAGPQAVADWAEFIRRWGKRGGPLPGRLEVGE